MIGSHAARGVSLLCNTLRYLIILILMPPVVAIAAPPPPAPPPAPPGAEQPDGVTICSIPNPDRDGIYYELIVGEYQRAGRFDTFPPDCNCSASSQNQDNCPWRCLQNSDYTRALKFKNNKTELSDGNYIWVMITAKHAELNTLISLFEKGASYRFCAYKAKEQPANFSDKKFYRFHPYFTPKKVPGGINGK